MKIVIKSLIILLYSEKAWMILAYCNPRCKIQIGLIRHPLQSRGRKQGKAMNDNENKLNQPTHPVVVATGPRNRIRSWNNKD